MSFIPGMTGPGSMTGQFTPLSLTSAPVIASNWSEDSSTISYPVGYTARKGDVAFLYDYVTRSPGGGNPSTVIPSGFTSLRNVTGRSGETSAPDFGMARFIISYRILDGSESGSLTGMIQNRYEGKAILIVRGNVRIKGVTLKGAAEQEAGTIDQQNVNSDTGIVPILVYGFTARSSSVGFTVNSPAFATQITDPTRFRLGYTAYASNPQDHSVRSNGFGVDIGFLASGWFEFT